MSFKHFGVMLDCSRNAVMKVSSVKKYIDILARLGYNTLMLYTEDTYEVENQPYFGYLRGRYSKAELKEIDAYASERGIELIPCIQTLAHLNAIMRWSAYSDICDCGDILLAGEDKTYALIEDIFSTLEECFTSRTVHLGMDEAHMLGLGKYLDKHGYTNRFDILTSHLDRVCEIAKAHSFKPLIWSDMFFRLATNGEYNRPDAVIDEKVKNLVPNELDLVYWDYYSTSRERYDKMFTAHKQFNNEIWFAGGLWCWNGFAPRNGYTLKTLDAQIPSAIENNIENIIFTLWGDDGKECSDFAVLPSLYYASCLAKGVCDIEKIKAGFLAEFGIEFDSFMLLDLPDTADPEWTNTNHNPEKYMFYNDCFYGIYDCTVEDGFVPNYDKCADRLSEIDGKEYGYLFDAYEKLCRFMQIKYTIGKRTRAAYRSGDKAALELLIADYDEMLIRLDAFYNSYKNVWFSNNKPNGFDVQDLRMGGLERRLKSCRERLAEYMNGKIKNIPELEEDILPEYKDKFFYANSWAKISTVNVIAHY